jgi:hypothetical protein
MIIFSFLFCLLICFSSSTLPDEPQISCCFICAERLENQCPNCQSMKHNLECFVVKCNKHHKSFHEHKTECFVVKCGNRFHPHKSECFLTKCGLFSHEPTCFLVKGTCGHSFHEHCIKRWLLDHEYCPFHHYRHQWIYELEAKGQCNYN